MRILLIGATGLVGSLVADQLLTRGHHVHALVRRATGRSGKGWNEQVASIGAWPDCVTEADAAISCLGTTRKQAGSEQAFRAVDHDAVLAFARAAHAAGVPHFLTISSVGAEARSRNLYLRTKGETDDALSAIGFARLDTFRPGLLLGARKEHRMGERLATILDPLARMLLPRRYTGIRADLVASAAAAAAERTARGRFVHDNAAIERLAAA